jgi:hypothetical protein
MCDGEQDDHNRHQHAIEDHEFDFVVCNGAIEAVTQLSDTVGASNENRNCADTDGWDIMLARARGIRRGATYTIRRI